MKHALLRLGAPAWFIGISLLALGPLLKPGYLQLLDSPTGPRAPWISPVPSPSEGLVSAAAAIVSIALRPVAYVAPEITNKLLIIAVMLVGGIGLFVVATRHLELSRLAALAGGTLYVTNPFVYERLLAGHLLLLLAYSLVPWCLPNLIRIATKTDVASVLGGASRTAAVALVDLHIGAMLLLLVCVAVLASRRSVITRLRLSLLAVFCVAALHLFWILPVFLAGEPGRLGSGDIAAYASRPRSAAVLPHILLLHGFWRQEFTTPLRHSGGTFLAMFLPLIAFVAIGVVSTMHSRTWLRPAAGLGTAALIGAVLGMGISLPLTASLVRGLHEHFPGYGLFREPQKWVALLALAYAIFLAVGLHSVSRRAASIRTLRYLILAIPLLPLLATNVMLWGFNGQVTTSDFPRDWSRAEQLTSRPGMLLFLPWNLYQPLPFADNRVIATPAEHVFDIPVLLADDPALGTKEATQTADPRVRYVSFLIEHRHRLRRFGHLVAPLGVRYIALAHIADAPEYGFLRKQRDLQPILQGSQLTLYENRAWKDSPYSLSRSNRPPSLNDVLSSGSEQRQAAMTLVSHRPRRMPSSLPGLAIADFFPWESVDRFGGGLIGTTKPCGDGWKLGDKASFCHLGAVAAFDPSSEPEKLWRPGVGVQIAGYVGSGMSLVLIVVALIRGRKL